MVETAGLRDGFGEPGASCSERIPGHRESDLKGKLPSRLRLSNSERTTLAEIGKRLGRKALREVASVAKPDTIPGVVSETGRPEVRRLQTPAVSRPSSGFSRSRSFGGPDGTREPWLGIRPDRRRRFIGGNYALLNAVGQRGTFHEFHDQRALPRSPPVRTV
jgi:hypothetical protein